MNQIKLFSIILFLNSCYFGGGLGSFNTVYNLPSVGDTTTPSSSEYFYFDVDTLKYRSENTLPPLYEISTTEEYGDSSRRESVSNCEIPLNILEEEDGLTLSESTENLICILDVLEGDLVIKDIHLTFNFPEGMCSYVRTGLPWHFNREIEEGPIVITEETEGEDATTLYCDSNEESSAGCGDKPDNSACKEQCEEGDEVCQGNCDLESLEYAQCLVSSGCQEDEEDLCPGEVKCCSGGAKVNGEPWEPEQECFGGPALIAEGDIAIPYPDFYKNFVRDLPEGGLKEEFTLPNIIDSNESITRSSVAIANYHSQLDLSADDLRELERTVLPITLQESPFFPTAPRLFFEFHCLDEGAESLHTILVMIREWNTLEEFWDFYTDGGNDSADPDIEGEEGDECDYEDRAILSGESGVCNDSDDLDDYDDQDNYPYLDYSGGSN